MPPERLKTPTHRGHRLIGRSPAPATSIRLGYELGTIWAQKVPVRQKWELDYTRESVMATPRDRLLDKISRVPHECAAQVEDPVDSYSERASAH
jgi:hypothetical protein